MVAPFLIAVQFLTRVPVPPSLSRSGRRLRWSTAFYPLVGVLVGLASALVWHLLDAPLSPVAASLAAVAAAMALTGALHEDGLADCADALGAGGSRQRMLEIMRDSRIGSFGASALIVAIASKLTLISLVPPEAISAAFVLAHSGGRLAPLILGRLLPDARSSGLGSSFRQMLGWPQIGIGLVTVACASVWLQGPAAALKLLPGMAAATLLALFFVRRLGGLTGDCQGAVVQVFEVFTYAAFAWKTAG